MKVASLLSVIKNYSIPTDTDVQVSVQDKDGNEKVKSLIERVDLRNEDKLTLVLPDSVFVH